MPDEKVCKCKNKDRCLCKKIWGMGDKINKLKKKKKKEKVLIKENVNLRRQYDVSLYPFPELDPWIKQLGKPMKFKEIETKKSLTRRFEFG